MDKGGRMVNKKVVLYQTIITFVGSGLGILVHSVMGSVLLGLGAALLVAIGASAIMTQNSCASEMSTSSAPTDLKPKAVKQPSAANRHSDTDDEDMLGMAEDLGFASQQLVWGVSQYRNVLQRLGKLSDEISRNSEINASNIEEATAGVEEIASAASTVSKASKDSFTQCQTSSQIARKHHAQIEEVSQSMLNVTRVVQAAVRDIDELNIASGKITDFVEKIRGIASQTNLLALNAAIEAARAGENGRGFAVVAEEVRKLAGESELTTKEIEDIVREITDKTAEVTKNMQAGNAELQNVEIMAKGSADAINEIVHDVDRIEENVNNLCSLSDNQRDTTEQMAKVIETIGHATVHIAGSTHTSLESVNSQERNIDEIFSHAKSMLATAEKLQTIASRYKKDDEIIFGINPFVAPQTIKESYVPILEQAAKRIGYKARVIIVSDYDALGKAVTNQMVDIGWFSPFAYVSTKERANIIPIVTPIVNKATSYIGYIIARKDSGIDNVDHMAGKRFGFVDQKSASGYVYPKALLVEHGKNPDTYFGETHFLGSHNRVIEEVLNGGIDAGATYSEAMDAAKKAGVAVDKLRIVSQTDPIPKDVIAASPGFDNEIVEKLRVAFESLTETQTQCNKTKINGFVKTNDSDYEVVRKASALGH